MNHPGPATLLRFGTLLTPRRATSFVDLGALNRPETLSGADLKSLLELFTYLQIARGAVNFGVLLVVLPFVDQHALLSTVVLALGFWTVGFALVVSLCWACTSSRVAAREQHRVLSLMAISPYVGLVLSALGAWVLMIT
jgi:hypothetical protein